MRKQHRGVTVWFTGLSGAEKTTLSQFIGKELISQGYNGFCLFISSQ